VKLGSSLRDECGLRESENKLLRNNIGTEDVRRKTGKEKSTLRRDS
jgi:hypothetical protein